MSGAVVALLVLIGIRNAILGYGVRPAVYGKSVHIHPAMVLVVLPAGYELAGVIGLFAAVPVAAIIFAVAGATIAILDPGPRPGLPALVPSWLDRVAAWSWRILVALALAALFIGIFVAMPLVVDPGRPGVDPRGDPRPARAAADACAADRGRSPRRSPSAAGSSPSSGSSRSRSCRS